MKLSKQASLMFGAKRIGDECYIQVADSKHIKAAYLGRGKFTVAFRRGYDVYLYSRFGDCSKEMLALLNYTGRNPHIPLVKKIEVIEGPQTADWDIHVYKTHYLNPITAANERAWKQMYELNLIHDQVIGEDSDVRPMVGYMRCYDLNQKIIDRASARNNSIPKSLVEALDELNVTSANYGGDYLFDAFTKANCRVNSFGRLMLIDPMFDAKLLHGDIKARMEEMR